ncbi:MAG: class I SAM-dependent methyltransferase [Bacteroidia bacterium]
MSQHKQSSPAHSADHLVEARKYWWNEDYLALLAQRLDIADCQNMADIGCGRGLMSFNFSPFLPPGANVHGLDIEETHLKKARQQARNKKQRSDIDFAFTQGNANALPFETEQMDFTLCQTLLIHVEDPMSVLMEMKRITREDGWVVAIEPNNLAIQLMFDRYVETDYEVEDMLQMMEVRLRCEKGKKVLGEGYSSLGDVLPDLFHKAGLQDIQVWMSDKAMSAIPPYDSREQRVRVAQLIDWLETDGGNMGYEVNLRYYMAGGGKRKDFDTYWFQASLYKRKLLASLKDQEYISAGGNIMYIVAGRV